MTLLHSETAAGAVRAKSILLRITAFPFNNIGIEMSLRKNARLLFAFSFTALFVCMSSDSESHAQHRRRQAGAELGRFLGFGYGNGYHCRTPGPNTDYYNPYSEHNSHLVSHYQQGSNFSNHYYNGGGIDQNYVPHSVYQGQSQGAGSNGYSVFDSVPGQTLTPTFEPVPKRKSPFDKEVESRDLDDELERDAEDSRLEAESRANDFRSRLRDAQDSPLNDESDDSSDGGVFDSLREDLEDDIAEPSELDQALFFGN